LYPRSTHPNGIPGVGYDKFPKQWFNGVDKSLIASRTYDRKRNKYGVKAGQDQVGSMSAE
jgi:hypothetical protein